MSNTIVEVINENTIVEIIDEYIDIIKVGIQGPPGTGMPAGGLKDEILTKKSDANYDYEWKRFKTVLEKYKQIPEEELRDGLLWNNTSNDSIQYYDGNNIKSLLYSEGSRHDQVLCGSSLPGGNLILKSTSSETKGSIIIPEFNSAGIIISNENGHLTVITQLLPENLPSHSSLTAKFGVASKELYGHVKIGSGIIVDNGVIEVDISTGKGLRYIGENPNKYIEIDDTVVTLNDTQTLENKTLISPLLTSPIIHNGNSIIDENNNELLTFVANTYAKNNITIENARVSTGPKIYPVGEDTNIDLILKAKGTGSVKVDNDIITTNNANQILSNKILIEPIIDNLINANHDHSDNINGGQITDSALSSPVTPVKGGTGFSSYTLGDIIYAASNNTLNKLPGNTTIDTKLLAQTGTGTASNAPEWKKYKHEQVIGDGVNTEYMVNHNLNTRAHTISIWRNEPPYDEIDYYVEKTTLNTVTLYFSRVLEPNEFSVVIIG